MSLEEELVELNSVYQDSREEISMLHEHIDALEKLVKAQRDWMLDIAPRSYLDGAKAAPLREQFQSLMEGKYDDLSTASQ